MAANDLILNPTLYLGWFEWREPITTLTDLTVSLICIYAVVSFARHKGQKSKNFFYYQGYFLCFAIGMMSAAWLGHGLVAYVGTEWKVIGWIMSIIGYLFLGNASLIQIKPITPKRNFDIIRALFAVQIVMFLFLILNPFTRNFKIAQIGSIVSLIGFILPMHLYNYSKTKQNGSLLIISAIIFGLIPAIVYNTQFSFSHWFNYHDISHVLVAINMVIIFIGAKHLSTKTLIKTT